MNDLKRFCGNCGHRTLSKKGITKHRVLVGYDQTSIARNKCPCGCIDPVLCAGCKKDPHKQHKHGLMVINT